ncbi:phage baseplate assembly protein V, partial [Flavobacterium sp. LBUM151]
MQFYGIVTKVRIQKSRIKDMEETMIISGYGSSIMMENGPETNSFIKMPLADIINKIKSGYDLDIQVLPFYKDILAYTVQYNESDFDFLNRLAKRYGQWFYYTGRTLVFGSPGGHGPEVSLVYGVNFHDFMNEIKLKPTLFKIIENDNRNGASVSDNTLNYRKEIDGFHQNFVNKSNQVFNKETVIQLNQNSVGASGRNTAEEYTKNKMRAVMSGLMQIKGISEVPGITLGNNVRITDTDTQLDSTYRVTQITHTCDDGGDYVNHFTAVNFSGSVFSPKTNPNLVPYSPSQSAIVVATEDSDGLGGITVQMPWQKVKGGTTPFVPMVQLHGGDGKGFHWLPEIGETVYVEFQGGNAEMPIVTGTLTNKNEKSGYSTPNNDYKVMRTRSGILIVYNDADGSLLIEDPSGNKYFMDGKGNINLDAPKNITLNAGENINMNAGQNMTTTVGFNKNETVGGDYTETITGSKYITIGINFILNVVGNMFELIKGNKETESKGILEDFKPLSFIYVLLFFSIAVQDLEDIKKI